MSETDDALIERRLGDRRKADHGPSDGVERRATDRRGAMIPRASGTMAARRRYSVGLADGAQCLAFWIGDEEYGLPLAALREIMFVSAITHVPRAPSAILGVLSLRGDMVTVVDMKRRMAMGSWQRSPRSRIIVVRYEQELYGLTVDQVSGVVRYSQGDVETTVGMAGTHDPESIAGILHRDERMIILLNLSRLFDFNEQGIRVMQEMT